MVIAAICCLLVGILFIVIGSVMVSVMNKSKAYTGYTEAEVISVEFVNNSHKPVLYYSVDGEEYTKMMKVGHNPPKYKEGQILTIRYNELEPREFCIDGDSTLSFMGYIFVGLGGLMLVIGIILFILWRLL